MEVPTGTRPLVPLRLMGCVVHYDSYVVNFFGHKAVKPYRILNPSTDPQSLENTPTNDILLTIMKLEDAYPPVDCNRCLSETGGDISVPNIGQGASVSESLSCNPDAMVGACIY